MSAPHELAGKAKTRWRDSITRWLTRPASVDAALLLLLSAVVTTLWFRAQSFMIGGDFGAVPFHPSQMANQYLSAWDFWSDTGSALPLVINNQVPPIDFIFYLSGSALGLSPVSVEWLYTVLLSYGLGGCATYLLARTLFEGRVNSTRLLGLVAGAFYILNPIYAYSGGALSVLGSSIPRSALPLALFLAIAGIRKRDLRYALGLGLASLLLFAVFARAMEVAFFVVFLLALAIPKLAFIKTHLSSVKFAAKFAAIASLAAVTVNLFWIVPFALNTSAFLGQLASYPLSFVPFESQFTTPTNVLRLQGYWTLFVGAYVPYAAYYSQPAVELATFLVPILVVAALGWRRALEPEKLSLALLACLFIGLGLGTNLPFHIYEGLLDYLPFFKLFKDPWVFLEPLALVYSIFFGLSLQYTSEYLQRRIRFPSVAKLASLGLALAVLTSVSGPMVTGAASINWYQPTQHGVQVPTSYDELNDWLQKQTCDCAALLAPEFSGAYVATGWGYQGTNIVYRNLIPSRLVTGAGASIYGLQAQSTRRFMSYVYDVLSRGDPRHDPLPVNASTQASSWAPSTDGAANIDAVVQANITTPDAAPALSWEIIAPPGESTVGHWLTFSSNQTLDLSSQAWIDLWISSAVQITALDLGIQDKAGQTGWYTLSSHVFTQYGEWTLVAIPVGSPDGGTYNDATVERFSLRVVTPLDASPLPAGSAVISLGPLYVSDGTVPPGFTTFLLHALNVGYVILDSSLNGSFYPAVDPTPYRQRLANQSELPLVAQFGNLSVYANHEHGSLISIPDQWAFVADIYELSTDFESARWNSTVGFVMGPSPSGPPSNSGTTVLSVQESGPTGFVVRVNARGAFLLTLATTYDSRWLATLDGASAGSHVLAYGYANGWVINETGNLSIEIQFSGQQALEISIIISAVGVAMTGVIALVGVPRLRRVTRILRSWLHARTR